MKKFLMVSFLGLLMILGMVRFAGACGHCDETEEPSLQGTTRSEGSTVVTIPFAVMEKIVNSFGGKVPASEPISIRIFPDGRIQYGVDNPKLGEVLGLTPVDKPDTP